MIEADLTTRLEAITPHVYPLEAPEEFRLPMIIYSAINSIPVRDLSSAVGASIITFQIDCYDVKYSTVKLMANQASTSISTWADVNPIIADKRDDIDKTTQTPLYRSSLTVTLFDRGS